MAHKARINGTAYEVMGGMARTSGVSYSVKGGKVRIGGTVYDISFILPPGVVDITTNTRNADVNSVAYGNGYWVAGMNINYTGRIAYTNRLDGSWTTKTLFSGSSGDVYSITYANGYWVAAGGGGGAAEIAYTTDPSKTWTTKTLWTGNNVATKVNKVIYANGKWVAVGYFYGGSRRAPRLAYATDLAGDWTVDESLDGDLDNIADITYGGGYWVMVRGNSYPYYAYATDITGPWTVDYIVDGTAYAFSECNAISYCNGYFVVAGKYSKDDIGYARIAYSTSPNGTWIIKNIWEGDDLYDRLYDVTYANGYWAVSGTHRETSITSYYIAYSASLDGEWTTKSLWQPGTGRCIAYADGYWVTGGARDYVSGEGHIARIAYASTLAELPENYTS